MDPNLVIERCQDSKAEADEQGPILQNCCACDEAKFEVTFEGLWSRNTHPKVRKVFLNGQIFASVVTYYRFMSLDVHLHLWPDFSNNYKERFIYDNIHI